MSDAVTGRGTGGAVHSVPDCSPALADLSPRDKSWDKHRANADKVAALYAGSDFQSYGDRVTFCSEFLQFGLVLDDDVLNLKLRAARFCRVRHCPVCQWRRSLQWKARAYRVLPKIVEQYPNHRWLFVTLTVKNCLISELRPTLQHMNTSFRRMFQRKLWPAVGWLRSMEVTRGHDGSAHPHYHCLLMVKPAYFGREYLKKKQWIGMWQESLRVDYSPVMDIQAVKKGQQPLQLVPELLKYCTKESDLVSDREWFLELTRQMYKLKCVVTGGVLKDYLRELEDEPGDLIGESDMPEGQDEASVYFRWKQYENKYRLTDT